VEGGLLLDVVVLKSSSVFKLLSSENEALLIRGNSFLVLDLSLHILNSVALLDVEGDGLAGQSLDKDLHTTSESEDQVKGAFLLDVVVLQSSAVFELLAREDESLLVGRDSFLVLNFSLHVLDGVALLHVEGDGLASERLHEDLHATTEAEDEMEGRLFLDVVVLQSAAVFELLASEDEALLVGRNAFLVLDLSLDVLDGVRLLDVEGDGLAREGLHEDLHATAEAKHEVQGGLLLNVVVLECATVL